MIVGKEEFEKSKKKYLKLLKKEIFIYPTDSIYGMGCDATNEKLVAELRKIKNTPIQPLSVIAPNKKWVMDNCVIGPEEKKYVDRLGEHISINGEENRFTLILQLKNKSAIAKNVNQGRDALGVRIPNNWFSQVVEELKIPIITTSANRTGEDFMTSLEDLNQNIKKEVGIIIYEGEKHGRPSTIINLHKQSVEIMKR